MYLSFGILVSDPKFSFSVSKLFCGEVFVTFLILSAILLPIKLPAAFECLYLKQFVAFKASVAGCLA